MSHCTKDPNTCQVGHCSWPGCQTIAELGEDFVAENDKPLPKPPFNWLRLEMFCVEVGAWLLIAGFVAFFLYLLHQFK